MRVLGISGSMRRDSLNRKLLGAAAGELPAGVELEVWNGIGSLPIYDADIDGPEPPAPVAELRAAIERADALLIATPEYNHSIPGGLKNALDWASRPFPDNAAHGKPAAVIGASTGLFGAVWAQAEVRKVLGAMGAEVIDEELPVGSADDAFDADGSLRDPDLAAELRRIVAELVTPAREPALTLAA